MFKLIALFSGLALLGVAGGYLTVKYQEGDIKIFESFITPSPTISSEVTNDNIQLIQEAEHRKNIKEQVKAEVLAELENQRVVIANQQEAQRQAILQQQEVKRQAILQQQEVKRQAILQQQEVQRQAILQQQKEIYLKQQIEQSRIMDLQNKCKEIKIKTLKSTNKLKEALIGSGDNIYTQFGDSQIESIKELGDIEYQKCLQNIK